MDEQGIAWRQFLKEASRRLQEAGLPSPEIDARRLVEEAAGVEPAEYMRCLDQLATVRSVAHFDHMLERRLVGEPLQYVLGRWAFRTLDLAVDKRVLIPRPETEVVAGYGLDALAAVRPAPARASDIQTGRVSALTVADLGTGSGAIGLSIASERADTHVWCTDRSEDALAVARSNLAGLGRIGTRVSLAHGSWFAALPGDMRGAFDLVISNPPYVATDGSLDAAHDVTDWEPHQALFAGADGLDDVRHIVAEASHWLTDHGALVMEIGEDQGEAVRALALAAGFPAAEIRPDLTGRDRALVASRRAGSAQ